MTDERIAELLDLLPETARAAVAHAIHSEATPSELAALETGFAATAFPTRRNAWDTPILVEVLTPPQRALAELTCQRVALPIGRWRLPLETWVRRRWLGLDDGGPWEELVPFEGRRVPLWHAYLAIANQRSDDAVTFFRQLALPIARRLEALGDAALGAYRIDWETLPWGTLAELDDVCAAWAPGFAARAAELLRVGDHNFYGDRRRLFFPLFLSLVRAGVAIEPRWDQFLPAALASDEIEPMRQCLRALPVERRLPALMTDLRARSDGWSPRLALALLPDFPSLALAQVVIDGAKLLAQSPLPALEKIASAHPEIEPALAPLRKRGRSKPRLLTCARRWSPKRVEQLTAIQRRQLEVARGEYDDLSARVQLTDETLAEYDVQIRQIVDGNGRAAYDQLLLGGDSGVVFRAGTEKIVGRIIQHNVRCDGHAELEAALRNCDVPDDDA